MNCITRRKRFGTALLILMIIFACSGTGICARADYENVLDDRIYNNEYLVIRKDPTGKVGKSMNIPVMVRANDRDLEDVWVGLSRDINSFYGLPQDGGSDLGLRNEYPFEINESTFEPKKLGKIKEGNVRSVTLNARVRRDMKEGYYCIPIAIYLHGKDGSEETDYMNIWIEEPAATDKETTEDTSEDIVFVMGEEQNIPYGVFPEPMDFSINLRNKSQAPAYDVTVSMVLNKSDDEFPFMIYDGNYDRHFDVIEAGEMVGLPYNMAIREDSYTGYYPLKFKISYRESINGNEKIAEGPGAVINAEQGAKASTDTTVQTAEHEFYVHITSKEHEEEETRSDFNENDRTKARIIVEKFRTEPEKIMAGEEFNLILTMRNASTDVSASNILFTLEPEKVENATVFSTESGSSSIVVNALGAGASAEIQTKFLAKPGIDQRSYTITIKEKYDSPEFKNAEETVSIDIPVYQQARISTSTFEVMPESIEVGQESNIMFGINNTGRVQLYNVNARFEADSIRTAETYVGNIKPGETGNVDLMITGEAATQDDGKIKVIISYEDESGEVTETEKELTLFVTEPLPEEDEFSTEEWENLGEDTENKTADIVQLLTDPNNRKYVLGAGVAFGILFVAGVSSLIKRRKRKKQQKEEEEGLDDEIS